MPTQQSLIRRLVPFPGALSSKWLQAVLTLGVLITGLSLTSFAWYYTTQETQKSEQQAIDRLTTRTIYRIKNRLQTYFEALYAGQALFAVNAATNRAQWKTFVETLDLRNRYPGINGLGFIRAVASHQKTAYEWQVRQAAGPAQPGFPRFRIKPAGTRSDYFVIEYIEPVATNLPAVGLDIKSESRRRLAAERARDLGEVAMTAPIVLVQDQEKKPGVLILLPIYQKSLPAKTLPEKRRSLLGFVYAPLKIRDLIQEALLDEPDGAQNFQVYDNQELLYQQDHQISSTPEPQNPPYQSTQSLDVGGRLWAFHFTASSSLLNPSEQQFPLLVLGVGALLTLLLTGLVNSLVSSRQRTLARNQAMLAAIPDLLLRLKRDGTCVAFIPPADAKAGTFLPVQQHISEVLPPDLVQHQLQRMECALATGDLQVWEHQVVKHGKRCEEEIRLAPCGHGEVLLMVRDITAHKEARFALEKEFRRSKALLKSSFDGIVVLNQQGNVVEASPSFAHMLGYSLQDVTALNVADWDAQWTKSELLKLIQSAKLVDKPFETRHRRRDGSEYEVEISVSNVSLEHETLQICICRDISDRKQKEQALEQAMAAAEAANLAKSRFLANMSHELRTPLNAILGFTELMAHDPNLPKSLREDVEIIYRSGSHLLELINDILDLSKIEANQCTLAPASFDLTALLHSLHTLLAGTARAKGIHLQVDIAPQVPQFVVADTQKLRQILLNLLGNAIKFTPQGSVTLRVSSTSNADGSHILCFAVIDTGVGIAATDLDLIFDAFAQADAGKQAAQGTGLGLTICRQLATLMGGSLTVVSTVGQGSTFTVNLPVQGTQASAVALKPSDRSILGLAPNQRDYRILVVDDQRYNRALLRKLLSRVGLKVQEATSGSEAIQLWQEWQPHLIWMDVHMSGMDGYEVTRQIRAREQGKHVIIIALTASAAETDRVAALQAGCDDFLAKPFNETVFFQQMAQHLGVRYVYADPEPVSLSPPSHYQPLTPSDLNIMSAEWIAQMHDAALNLDERLIYQLLEQIPHQEQGLINALTTLVDHFQLEVIAGLTCP